MSTEKKFTQGEWKQKESLTKVWGLPVNEVSCGGFWIAQVRGEGKEKEANAKLIAAAPDLLEACERALETLENENIFGQARLLLAVAIKKATE